MAKLCVHHQRQIVHAIGFLQTEVKALTSSTTQQDPNSTSGIQGSTCSTAKFSAVTPEKSCPELRLPCESTPKSEVQDVSHPIPSNWPMKKDTEIAVSLNTGPGLDLRRPGSGSNQPLVSPTTNPVDIDNNHHGDHAPLKMKIMASNVADGKKLSCVLNTSLSSRSDFLEYKEDNLNASNRTETHSARLSSSVKRHSQASLAHQARQQETLSHVKDASTKLFSVHMTIPSESPRTARKTTRTSSDHRIRESACRGLPDPDLGHCDIVFIDKPITECFKERQRIMLPRRNARKSTRGHMYSDEIWELKTVRTLAGRGNCPNPMPELMTLVTPKQILSKPEGVPPVDMPFAGAHGESLNQQMSTEESDESVIPETGEMVEVAASEVDIIVETSQTDQCQSKGQSVPPSPIRSPAVNREIDMNTDLEQDTTADSGMTTGSEEESVAQVPLEAEKDDKPELQEDIHESTKQIVAETVVEPLENITTEENEPHLSSEQLLNNDAIIQQNNSLSPINQVEVEGKENKRENIHNEQPQELQPETRIHYDNLEVPEDSNTTGLAGKSTVKKSESKSSESVDSAIPLGTEDDNDDDYDVSSKTLDALSKELPPWRRKRGTVISLPKRLRQTETVVVGYFNGRPISASDRSLRRRSSSSTASPNKTPVKSSRNAPNKTFLYSAIASKVENENFKNLPETLIESFEATSVIQQVKEPSSATPSSPVSKTTQFQKHKRFQRYQNSLSVLSDQLGDHPQSTESKRQLRSAGQRPAGLPVSPPSSHTVPSILSAKPTATQVLLPTDHLPFPLLSSPLPVTAPPILIGGTVTPPATSAVTPPESPPATDEQSQQNTVPETTVECKIDKAQSVKTASEEIRKIEGESRLQAKQKLRSAKAVVEDSKNEKQQLSIEENQSLVKTEIQTQIMPLRSKRVLRKEAEISDVALLQKSNVAPLGDMSGNGHDQGSMSDKPTRMPLRSENSKPEMSHQNTQSLPVDNKKFSLRSQRLAALSTCALPVAGEKSEVASPIRIKPERIPKAQVKPTPVSVASGLPHSSSVPIFTLRHEPPRQTGNKFFETLTGEESQHLITNLNLKYDKMQKGWVQMDKEGQPATKYKNKADRQAAIWKSKRRARKAKSLEHQKYSPVQMLFMKGFNLSSICRWFLESTETKSLVIVKKVNTRLPSETQLCFHSSSNGSGTSQGVFPSVQAERLKKHLKKFAIASPVKSNPKSQKLIAKALEQEANAVKGKERRELPSTTQTLAKSHSSKTLVQIGESQKSSGKSKNPASARILRKYSNIREKMQVQQTNSRLKEASKTLRTKRMKRLATTKPAAKSNVKPCLKAQKSPIPVSKQIKESAAKMERRKTLTGKKPTKHPAQERIVKAQSNSRILRDTTKKELPKRCSQRLGSPKISEHKLVETSKSKQQLGAELVKPAVNKTNAARIQTKESSQTAVAEIKSAENAVETPQQMDVKVPASPDQVLTRSQRRMEAAGSLSGSPCHASKKMTKSIRTQNASPKPVRKAEDSALTRSGALKSPAKKSQAALLPRSATKSATKRTHASLEIPAKRTRTALSK